MAPSHQGFKDDKSWARTTTAARTQYRPLTELPPPKPRHLLSTCDGSALVCFFVCCQHRVEHHLLSDRAAQLTQQVLTQPHAAGAACAPAAAACGAVLKLPALLSLPLLLLLLPPLSPVPALPLQLPEPALQLLAAGGGATSASELPSAAAGACPARGDMHAWVTASAEADPAAAAPLAAASPGGDGEGGSAAAGVAVSCLSA